MAYLHVLYASMKFVGLWPKEDGGHSMLTMKIFFVLLIYHAIGIVRYLILAANDPNVPVSEKSDALFITSSYLNLVYNIASLFSQRHKMANAFRALENFDDFGKPDNLQRIVNIINATSFILTGYCGVGGFAIPLFAIGEYEMCIRDNEIGNTTIPCGFATKTSYPYYTATGLSFYIHLILQVLAIWLSATAGVMIVTIGLAAFELVIVRIDHLKVMLGTVFLAKDDRERRKRFRRCIMYHIYIIQLAEQVVDSLKVATTPALVNYSICIGSTLLAFLVNYSFTAFINGSGWIVSIYIMCLSGQRMLDKSLSVADAAYDMQWYLGSAKLQKDILFMIVRAKKPIKYPSGVIGDFHYITFSNIMSTAYKISTLKTGVGN